MADLTLLFHTLHQAIQAANRILIVADGSPDGDSIGSTSALAHWLKGIQKDVTIYCASPLPKDMQFLHHTTEYKNNDSVFDEVYDLVITCDMSDTKNFQMHKKIDRLKPGYTLWVIDHHATNTRYGHRNLVDTTTSATCELVYRFFEHQRIPVNEAMATSLLTGILYDTSSFVNAATTDSSMKVAGYLLDAGARWTDIQRHMIRNKSLAGLQLWGTALARLRYHEPLDLASTYFLATDLSGIPRADELIAGMSNFLNRLCVGCDAVLVLHENQQGEVRGSFRSLKRDVSKLAKLFGGGGHKLAAGFMIKGKIQIEKDRVWVEPTTS